MPLRTARRFWRFIYKVGQELGEDNVMMMAAAVAFYTCLSLAPLVVLLVWVGGLIGPEAQDALTEEFRDVIGYQGAEAIGELVERARHEQPEVGHPWGVAGLLILIFAATRVFNQLQLAMNLIWDVGGKPRKLVWQWARKRLVSMAMIGAVAFLLLVSLVLSAAIEFLAYQAAVILPDVAIARVGNTVASFLVFMIVFAGIFKFVPDVHIEWRDVWFGATITATLFVVGKHLIGYYLGQHAVSSAYGAAGALVLLLLWVYYSTVTLFVGAEITQVWSRRSGRGLEAAVPGEEVDERGARKAAED